MHNAQRSLCNVAATIYLNLLSGIIVHGTISTQFDYSVRGRRRRRLYCASALEDTVV